jgi:clan AA aspartic protease
MGEIRVRIKLSNETDEEMARRGLISEKEVRSLETDAVVDTGAVRSVIPQSIRERLGVSTPEQMYVTYADGRSDNVPLTSAICFRLLDRRTVDEAAVIGDEVLIGQTILEKTDLLADCSGRRLIPNPEHPDKAITKIR